MQMRRAAILFTCVASAVLPDAAAHALGGKASSPADAGLRSHAVMVLGSRGSACTGTLIAADVVLTAGHCVQGSKELAIAWFDNGKPVLEAVRDTATHPQFSGRDRRSIDLALVRLARPLGGGLRPASLEKDDAEPSAFRLAGFGLQTSYDEASAGKLRSAEASALPLSTSRMLHLGLEADAGGTNASNLQVCKGDSGGPVFSGVATLSGVIVATYNANPKPGARWSAICGNTAQAVRIGPQSGWIEGVMSGWR